MERGKGSAEMVFFFNCASYVKGKGVEGDKREKGTAEEKESVGCSGSSRTPGLSWAHK